MTEINIILCFISLLVISRFRRHLFRKYGSINVVVRLQRQGVANRQEKRADHSVPPYVIRLAAKDSVWPLLQLQSEVSAVNTGESKEALFVLQDGDVIERRLDEMPGRFDNISTCNTTVELPGQTLQ